MNGYKENFTSFFHWFAWTISGLASLFFLFFEIGEDVTNLIAGNQPYLVVFVPGLLIAATGCVVSFFRKITGGIVMIAGGGIMLAALYFYQETPDFRMMFIYGLPYIFPGILFVFVRK